MSKVAAIVQDETTADAVSPVLTECRAVINISVSCFSFMYAERYHDMADMPSAKAAPTPTIMP